MKIAPAMRSAWSAASSSAPPAMAQWATMTQRGVPVASRTARASSASGCGPYSAAVSGRSERPLPRGSKVTTRKCRAR